MAVKTDKNDPTKHRIKIWYGQPKPFDKTFRGTKAEAKEYDARMTIELRGSARLVTSGPAPKFSDFCLERYAPRAQKYLGKKTYQNRRYQLALLIEFFGDLRLDRFTVADYERYQDARIKAGIGPAKINDDLKALTAILNYARSLGLPATAPKYERLTVPKKSGRVKVWTETEVDRIYGAFQREAPQLLGMTVAMLNTGMRKGEVIALEHSCVDLKRGIIKIHPNEEWQPKDNEPREVTIPDALRVWLEKPAQHPRWVFPTLPTMKKPQGDRYTQWPQRGWDRARKASGVGGSPHVCRHTFASHYLANGGSLYHLAGLLGHSTQKTTSLYEHLVPGYLEATRGVVNLPVPLRPVPLDPKPSRRRR